MTIEIPCCGNCQNHTTRMCEHSGGPFTEKRNFCGDRQMDYREVDAHAITGCLSHPNARVYLMKDVVEELKKKRDVADEKGSVGSMCNCYDGLAHAYDIAITLIKEGVKK